MNRRHPLPFSVAVVMWTVAATACPAAFGQYTPYQAPQSYSDYYHQSLSTRVQPQVSARDYTIDKYFAHRPTLSPYLQLSRPTSSYTNSYQQYVRPELNRRAASAPSPFPTPKAPSRSASPYYNHWYGGS